MMTIIIPYTFVAGTKAKANEVNANLRTLVTEINSQENQLVQVQSDIENLETTKASLNGNSSQRFSVANPVNSFDSVNKQTLSKSISNSVNVIDGYGIHKATNTTFIVDAGTCYDSTSSVILNKTVSSSKEISPISASTTYNVFVVGDDTGSSIDIIYSTTSVDPPLPSGYTKYRLIGTVTTNSNSQISATGSLSIDSSKLLEYFSTSTSWYRTYKDGFIEQGGHASGSTITFSKAFTTRVDSCVVTQADWRNDDYENFYVGNVTLTKFDVGARFFPAGFSVWYYACGY